MALSDTDRRRFLLATTLTLLALPALWWANESGNTRSPSIAAVGIEVGDTPAVAVVFVAVAMTCVTVSSVAAFAGFVGVVPPAVAGGVLARAVVVVTIIGGFRGHVMGHAIVGMAIRPMGVVGGLFVRDGNLVTTPEGKGERGEKDRRENPSAHAECSAQVAASVAAPLSLGLE